MNDTFTLMHGIEHIKNTEGISIVYYFRETERGKRKKRKKREEAKSEINLKK